MSHHLLWWKKFKVQPLLRLVSASNEFAVSAKARVCTRVYVRVQCVYMYVTSAPGT